MTILEKLEQLRADPTRLQGVVYDSIAAVRDGALKVVDPTNPTAVCIEAVAFTASNLETKDWQAQRAVYPALANTWEDLYRHMSDEDFIGRFHTPSTLPIRFVFSVGELKRLALPIGDTGITKVTLPKHTVVTVASTDWLLQYPVQIIFMPRGGIRVVYDTDVVTPLMILESNLVEWTNYHIDGEPMIELTLPMQQMTLTRYLDTLSAGSGFRKSYTLTDNFYYCRVYGRRGNGTLTEIKTTHSNEVYDPRVPTAVLEVRGEKLEISIPLIYFTNGLLPAGIQIDIFTTKGELAFTASDYVPNAFGLTWGADHNSLDEANYASPLSKISTMSIYSIGISTGGTNGLTFEQLRENTIANANKTNLPITPSQLESALMIRGYQIIKSIDNVVKRVYLASRSLSASNSGFSVGAGCGIISAEFPISQFVGQSKYRDNGNRVTLLDGLLFDLSSGVPNYVTENQIAQLRAMPRDRFLTTIAQSQYVYTPVSYVLDMNNNGFAVRAYDFNNPEISGRQFVMENDTAGVSCSTASLAIQRIANGYELYVVTSSDEGYKALEQDKLFCQLYFRPDAEADNAHLNGELVGLLDGEYVWKFTILTNFDVDDRQRLWLTNFAMFVAEAGRFPAQLSHQFGLLYGLVDLGPVGFKPSEIDALIGRHLAGASAIAITHERVTLSFAYHMKDLWCNGRTVAGNLEYLRHQVDVPLLYRETEYLRNNAGDIVLDPLQEPPYTVLKRKGDPVVIDGEVQYLARKGDLVYDEDTGEPIAVNTRKSLRIVDLLFVDGVYYFSTGEADIAYRDSIPRELKAYLKQDLANISARLLERTSIFLYPKKTIGQVNAFIQDGQLISLPAGLSFTVKYWLNEASYANESLRESIRNRTHDLINALLKERQVGTDDLIVSLRGALGNDIIAVDVDKFGPRKDIPNYTMFDDTARCSVKRKLKALPDGTNRVVEDITIEFILHRTA